MNILVEWVEKWIRNLFWWSIDMQRFQIERMKKKIKLQLHNDISSCIRLTVRIKEVCMIWIQFIRDVSVPKHMKDNNYYYKRICLVCKKQKIKSSINSIRMNNKKNVLQIFWTILLLNIKLFSHIQLKINRNVKLNNRHFFYLSLFVYLKYVAIILFH